MSYNQSKTLYLVLRLDNKDIDTKKIISVYFYKEIDFKKLSMFSKETSLKKLSVFSFVQSARKRAIIYGKCISFPNLV